VKTILRFLALFNAEEIEEEWFNEYDKKHYSIENKLIKLNKVSIENLMNNYDWKNDYKVKEIIAEYNDL